ncbi:hypothetical protein RHS01_02962 [Rhizoctonia solani]|uniref:Mid2 domain-containing protein n=1 Tax=Rhizoctonia solani TaxID=456999 RepID=A0A8H7IIA0_9AGAM|nr:hypothetical protein RHS01_02962 [Rhizoctonia solani]
MDFARRDMLVERRFEVIGAGPRLGKRQDPEPTTTESTPAQTPTSSTPPGNTSIPPTSTTPTASTAPIETTTSPTSPTSSDPVSTPVSTPTSTTPVSTPVTSGPSTPIETSQQSTPLLPPLLLLRTRLRLAQLLVTTRVITSVLTNGAGSTVTVLSTSTSVGPTASPSNSGSSNNTGAIVGGVVGGVGGLLLLIALLWFIRRKTHKDKFEENMFAPDRNVDRREMDLAGDDVDDPEAIARPYHLPPSPTRNEMAMSAATSGMSRPTSGTSYYTQPGSGMGMPMPMSMTMPMPMPMSRDHIAYTHSRANSTHDHLTQPSEPATSEGGSSSARLMKDREARRLHVANDNEVIVHTDGGRVDEEPEEDAPREIPPTYESIGGPSGAR